LQQQAKRAGADRGNLRSEGQQAFDTEMTQEKAGDCSGAITTVDIRVCYNQALTAAAQHLKTYAEMIRDLLSRRGSDLNGEHAHPGPDGMPLTQEQELAEFDFVGRTWQPYVDAACTAHHHQYGGGTGGPGAELACRVRLTRNHMKDLDSIYEMPLHN
jgi:uncharacterized protein YecT (DUF1311 family)